MTDKIIPLKTPLTFACVVLAAGKGTRMLSSLPKLMHQVAGKPIICHVLDSCVEAGAAEIVVVVSPDDHQTQMMVAPHGRALQREALGTGHAALLGVQALKQEHDTVLILNGDMPLLLPETIRRFAQNPDDLSIMTMDLPDPRSFGRVIVQNGQVEKIVEFKDATPAERAVTLCNTGVYAIRHERAENILARIGNHNAAKEYYLTDIVQIGQGLNLRCGAVVAAWDEVASCNTRGELAELETLMQNRLRCKFMAGGVTLIDPQTVYFSADTVIDRDVVIEPNVFFGPGVTVGEGTRIMAFSHVEGATIGNQCEVGPFARIGLNTKMGPRARVGNFVEIKRSTLGERATAKHLSYIGDATLGSHVNIGAGTITCNYDGFNRLETIIEDDAFVGSNNTLIAPVTIQKNAITAAGSVITSDVPVDALAIARAEQVILAGAAKRFRDKRRKDKK